MLVGHSVTYVAARVVSGGLTIVTTAALTRLLGPSEYGSYSFILIVMLLVSNIGFDWLNLCVLRLYGGRSREPGTFASFAYVFLGLVLVSGFLEVVLWMTGALSGYVAAYALGAGLAWVYSWFEFASQYEIASIHPRRYLLMTLARALLILITASAAAWLTHSALWAALLTGLAMLLASFLSVIRLELLAPRHFNKSLVREILTFGAPIAVTMGMLGVTNNGTRALLGLMSTTTALGLYTAVFVLVQQSLILIASGLGSAGYSLSVRAIESANSEAAQRQMLEFGVLMLAVMAPACLGMALTSRGLASLVLGSDYIAAAIVLSPWMATGAFFFALRAYYFDIAFHLGKRPFIQTQVAIVSALLAIGLGVILIPRLGSLGVAVAVTVSSIISCLHSALAGRAVFRLLIPFRAAMKIAVSCALMAIAVLLAPGAGIWGFFLQVMVGGAVYAAAAIGFDLLSLRTRMMSYLAPGRG